MSSPASNTPGPLPAESREAAWQAEIAALKARIEYLESRQPRYRDLFSALPPLELAQGFLLPVGTWDWDLHSQEVQWSRELYSILGYQAERDTATVEMFLAAVHPEDRLSMRTLVEKAMHGGSATRVAMRVVWPDGQVRNLQSEGIILRNGLGEVVRMIGFVIDVTEMNLQTEGKTKALELLGEAQLLAKMGSWVWNVDDGWVEWSDGIWRIVGAEPKARLTLAESLSHIHPDDRHKIISDAEYVRRDPDPQELEANYRVVRPDGEVRILKHRSRFLQMAKGKPRMRLGTVIDITESQFIQEELRRNVQLLNEAQLLGQSGYWIWDLDSGRVEWSDALCRITGMEHGGRSHVRELAERVHPDDRDKAMQGMKKAESGTGEMVLDFRILTPDGTVKHIVQRSRPYQSEEHGGKRLRLGTMVDVSELRRAEAKLVETHQLAKTALKLAKAGSWIVHFKDFRIVWSDDLYALMGVPSGTAVTPDFFHSLIHPEDLDKVLALEQKIRGAETIHWPPFRVIRPQDGDTRHFEMTGGWVEDHLSDGRIFLGVTTDVTERLRLEDAQQQKQKLEAIGRLAGGVAHDFNNLLTVMLGHAEEMNLASPNERLGQIIKAGRIGAALTQRLLAFSRQAVVKPQAIGLADVVKGMHPILERLLGEDIAIRYALSEEEGLISADVGQVEQVLLNLAINARDAMPEGGTLLIETRIVDGLPDHALPALTGADKVKMGRHWMLAVEDAGTGIQPKVLDQLFTPFFTTKELGKGTGLGLATVLTILTEAGGRIAVSSEVDEGTRFEAFWPLEHAAFAGESHSVNGAAAEAGQGRIGVVEDNPELRRLLVEMLESGGYGVLSFETPEAAVALDEREVKGLAGLVTDLVMPGIHGQMVAQMLREKNPALKVLFISGYPRLDLEGELNGDFLQKPFNRAQLLAAVNAMVLPPPGRG